MFCFKSSLTADFVNDIRTKIPTLRQGIARNAQRNQSMTDLNRSVLQQAVEALEYADCARRELVKLYTERSLAIKQQAAEALEYPEDVRQEILASYKELQLADEPPAGYGQILRADRTYDDSLSIAIPVASLYAARHSSEEHRVSRVASLLEECCSTHRSFEDSLAVFDSMRTCHGGLSKPKRHSCRRAGRKLRLAQDGLNGLLGRQTVSEPWSEGIRQMSLERQEPSPSRACANASDATTTSSASRSNSLPGEARYKWDPPGAGLRKYFTQSEIESVVVERLERPFYALCTTR